MRFPVSAKFKYYSFFAAYSFVLLLFCTKSSPLYAFNDWFDANVYFTMGKGLMNGYVPYVDLIDNKGPLLYFIYGLAYVFNHTGFTGMYVIQALFLSVSVIYVYKLAKLFIRADLIAAAAAVSSPACLLLGKFYARGFDYGGGGPDELCRSLLIVSLYYFVLFFQKNGEYKARHTVIQGVITAAVFLIKFNLAFFCAGFLFVIFCVQVYKKRFRYLFSHIAFWAAGFFSACLPYAVYILITGSGRAFAKNYIYYNAIYANFSAPLHQKMFSSITSAFTLFNAEIGFSALLWAGVIFVLASCSKGLKLAYILSLFVFLTISFMTAIYPYTVIPGTVFVIMGLVAAGCLAEKRLPRKRMSGLNKAVTCFSAVTVIFAVTVANNGLCGYQLFLGGGRTAQHQIAEIIESRSIENATLLNYGLLDAGFYTTSNIIPNEPYFYIPNIAYDRFPHALDAQNIALAEKKTDFVVLGVQDGEETKYEGVSALSENYTEIAAVRGTGYQSWLTFRLFLAK